MDELDIAVNAVATAVKDFFFKRLPPILGTESMEELESIACKYSKELLGTGTSLMAGSSLFC